MELLKLTNKQKVAVYGLSATGLVVAGNRLFNEFNPYVGIILWIAGFYMIYLICKIFKQQDENEKS